MNPNFRRSLLHLAFGAAAAVLTFIATNVTPLNLSPEMTALIVMLATAAASFFRGKANA